MIWKLGQFSASLSHCSQGIRCHFCLKASCRIPCAYTIKRVSEVTNCAFYSSKPSGIKIKFIVFHCGIKSLKVYTFFWWPNNSSKCWCHRLFKWEMRFQRFEVSLWSTWVFFIQPILTHCNFHVTSPNNFALYLMPYVDNRGQSCWVHRPIFYLGLPRCCHPVSCHWVEWY